jgi:hypothetical protein
MTNTDLFNRILNLGEGWEVKDILVNTSMMEVDVFIEHSKSTGYFPSTKIGM